MNDVSRALEAGGRLQTSSSTQSLSTVYLFQRARGKRPGTPRDFVPRDGDDLVNHHLRHQIQTVEQAGLDNDSRTRLAGSWKLARIDVAPPRQAIRAPSRAPKAEAVADVVGYSYEMRLNHAYYPVAGRIRS